MHTQSSPGTHSDVSIRSAVRVQNAFTANAERRLLEWIAYRTPRWITSDHLTALGLVAQFAAGLCYFIARWHRGALVVAVGCIALNWLGDSLDGTLARVRNRQRPRYGFYVDHVVDLFGTVGLLCGLAASGFMHAPLALGLLAAFLLLAGESYLATHTLGRFEMSQGPFGPTELRLLMIAGTLALLRSPWAHVLGHRILLFDLGGAIALLCMTGLAVVVAVRHAAQLFREEPLP